MRTSRLFLSWLLVLFVAFAAAAEPTVQETVARIADRLHAALDAEALLALDEATLAKYVTPEDRAVLATRHWEFDVDVPATVYVMREISQATTPFWLAESGFEKTDMTIAATEGDMKFEVWRKKFEAGHVGLGINGFDKHRPHYFVAVKANEAGKKPAITNARPAWQEVHDLAPGAFYYHDWSELGVAAVPDEMAGGVILPTMRGRAREAHFIGGFRKTDTPSSAAVDQIALTWNGDPRTSAAVHWRASADTASGAVRYRGRGAGGEWQTAQATAQTIEDKFIVNDRVVKRFTAALTGLATGTEYEYCIAAGSGTWTEPETFKTAPEPGTPFTFVFLSDTHNRPETGALLAKATELYPETAFMTISGDLVGTGQYREDWDALFHISAEHFRRLPIAPAIGNHDAIDGLGADLYLAQFALPENGPEKLQTERAYSFRYGNALFIMLDVMSPIREQNAWLEDQLKNTGDAWTFVVLHFPPYSPDESEPEINKEWVPLFDKNGADFVLGGHVHHYVRTHPLKGGEPQASAADGTTYLVTVSVSGRDRPPRSHPRAAVMKSSQAALCNVFTVDADRVTMKVIDAEGNVHDEMDIRR